MKKTIQNKSAIIVIIKTKSCQVFSREPRNSVYGFGRGEEGHTIPHLNDLTQTHLNDLTQTHLNDLTQTHLNDLTQTHLNDLTSLYTVLS